MKLILACAISALTATYLCADETVPWAEKTHALGVIDTLPTGLQSADQFKHLRTIGEELFAAPFTTLDGAGRPMATQAIIPTKPRRPLRTAFARTSGPDSNACGSCHNQPTLGGAGDFATNVFVSEGFNNHDFDTTDPEFSNERGTNHLFGAGLIELLAREMTTELLQIRSNALNSAKQTQETVRASLMTKGVSFGAISIDPTGLADLSELDGVDADLIIRPFSQKGVFVSLRQFTVNALNHHHGMQPDERWGARWTGQDDFDEDGHANEMSPADVSSLVAWQAALPTPKIWTPTDDDWRIAADAGANQFHELECSQCHISHLPLDSLEFSAPNPYDGAGTLRMDDISKPAIYDLSQLSWAADLARNENGQIMVPLFGDLKRHKMTDADVSELGNELFSQRFVGRDTFMTAELWGIGSTAPYGHRNDFTTLDEIIRAHGGDARQSRDAYVNANDATKSQIIAYLKTLRIEDTQ